MNALNRKTNKPGTGKQMKWDLVGLFFLLIAVGAFWNPIFRGLMPDATGFQDPTISSALPGTAVGTIHAADPEVSSEANGKRQSSASPTELRQSQPMHLKRGEPLSPSFMFEKRMEVQSDISKLSNGIPWRTEVVHGDGEIAIDEARSHDSYTATYQLKLRIPRPATRIAEIEKGTPGLRNMLPGFESLFSFGFVSPWHHKLYQHKISHIRSNSSQLGTLLTKSNVYDCNTLLHLRSEKGRKVFFMQANLDATLKGADGDRLANMPAMQVDSIHYDPFTAYHWKKMSSRPNPMIAGWERRIAIGRNELKEPSISAERKLWVEERIAMMQSGISAMKGRSYLISAYDPYIVLPLSILKDVKDPYAPKIGDYALVIHGGRIYPCIVGDKGSDVTIGEASARLAMQLNPDWRDGNKAVQLPVVSYLIFPESRDTDTRVPNYGDWGKKCLKLLDEIGGLGNGVELHRWTDQFPKQDSLKPK